MCFSDRTYRYDDTIPAARPAQMSQGQAYYAQPSTAYVPHQPARHTIHARRLERQYQEDLARVGPAAAESMHRERMQRDRRYVTRCSLSGWVVLV
jgi:hypothetical protein